MPRPLSVPRHKMQHYLLGCCVLNNNIAEEKLEYVCEQQHPTSENYTDNMNNFYIFFPLTNFRACILGLEYIHHYLPILDNFRHYLLAVPMMAVPKRAAVG